MVVLELEFENANKQKVTFVIDNPKLPINEADVSKVMDDIIEKNIFLLKNAELTTKLGAQVITKTVEDYPLA